MLAALSAKRIQKVIFCFSHCFILNVNSLRHCCGHFCTSVPAECNALCFLVAGVKAARICLQNFA